MHKYCTSSTAVNYGICFVRISVDCEPHGIFMFARRGDFLEVRIDVFIAPLSGFRHIRTLILIKRSVCLFRKFLNHSNRSLLGLATMVYLNVKTVTCRNLKEISRNQRGSSRFGNGFALRHISSPA